MIKKQPTKSFLVLAGYLFLYSQAGATVIIEDNFDGSAITGPALQLLSNGEGGEAGTFDTSTGVITTTTATNNTTGFNSSSLVALDSDIDTLTATFDVTSADVANASANGFFLGLVTGPDAAGTGGPSLFNNNPNSFGLQLVGGGAGDNGITQNNGSIIGGNVTVTDDSINDGFTFTLTLNSDNTFDASTTGLSADINLTGETFGAAAPNFNDFVTGGVGLNSTLQTTNGGSVDFNSVTLEATTADPDPDPAIPEPSSAVLLVGGIGCLALRRKRQK